MMLLNRTNYHAIEDVSEKEYPFKLTFIEPKTNLIIEAERLSETPLRYSIYEATEYHPLGTVERNENGSYTISSMFYPTLLVDISHQLGHLLRMYDEPEIQNGSDCSDSYGDGIIEGE